MRSCIICACLTLRQHGGFSGGVEGAGFGQSGTRPERSSVSWDNQSGRPPLALVHVSDAASGRFETTTVVSCLLHWLDFQCEKY